jgi:hypothetical protein
MLSNLLKHMIISTNTYAHICVPGHIIPTSTFEKVEQNNSRPVVTDATTSAATIATATTPTSTSTSSLATAATANRKTQIHMSPRKHPDSLFWCFSQIINNMAIETVNDQLRKIRYVDALTPVYASLRKKYALATFTSVSNTLAYEKKMNIPTLLALCAYEQLNVCIVRAHCHYICTASPDPLTHYYLIRLNDNGAFSYTQIAASALHTCTSSSILIDSDKTTMKSVSSYTAKQLKEYAEKICVPLIDENTGKPKIKQILYQAIFEKVAQNAHSK